MNNRKNNNIKFNILSNIIDISGNKNKNNNLSPLHHSNNKKNSFFYNIINDNSGNEKLNIKSNNLLRSLEVH